MKKITLNQLLRAAFVAVALWAGIGLQAKDVVFDFKANPWNLPVTPPKSKPDVAKLDETVQMEQEGVVMTHQKGNSRYWNRLFADALTVYSHNGITLTAPRGFRINGVDFYSLEGTAFDLSTEGEKDIAVSESNEDVYESKAQGVVLKYKNGEGISRLLKIVVHLEPYTVTAIGATLADGAADDTVYSLNGVAVGTANTFASLPKGIYILHKKKVWKR